MTAILQVDRMKSLTYQDIDLVYIRPSDMKPFLLAFREGDVKSVKKSNENDKENKDEKENEKEEED